MTRLTRSRSVCLGPWGSSKSTVLQLIETQLADRSAREPSRRILVVRSDPWRYDPAVGAKATLIGEVLRALAEELEHRENNSTTAAATKALGRLVRRVNWTKALTLAAKTSITLQVPSMDDLTSLVSKEPDGDDPGAASKTLDDFREEFAELLSHEALRHVSRVVVLVDDLDRCLPGTVIETLETMRLFLAVPKMSFVIAADEDRVADALRAVSDKGRRRAPGRSPRPCTSTRSFRPRCGCQRSADLTPRHFCCSCYCRTGRTEQSTGPPSVKSWDAAANYGRRLAPLMP